MRALCTSIALLILVTGIAIGLAVRQFGADAAPGDINACVNNYTGSVRMSPYGMTNCSANETRVNWAGVDTTGLSNLYVNSAGAGVSSEGFILAGASCDAGDVAVGGGFTSEPESELRIITNAPGDDPGDWQVGVVNEGPGFAQFVAYAKCATP